MQNTEQKIEDLIDSYTYAYMAYENSTTCNRKTYLKQEQDMYDAKNELMKEILKLIPEA